MPDAPTGHASRYSRNASHRVVHPQRLFALSVPALRLLRQPRALTRTGLPQRLSCNEPLVSPASGLKRSPLRGGLFHIPTLHPRRASPASPVGRGRGPAAAAVAGLRFPAFRFRSLCSLHLLSGRSRPSSSESRRGSLDAPRRVSPSLTLRASRPPSKRSASFLFLVYFCCFRCVIRCRFFQTVNSRQALLAVLLMCL